MKNEKPLEECLCEETSSEGINSNFGTKIKKFLIRQFKPKSRLAKWGLSAILATWIGSLGYGISQRDYWKKSTLESAFMPTSAFFKAGYYSARSPFLSKERLANAVLDNFQELIDQRETGDTIKIGDKEIIKEAGGYFIEGDTKTDFVPLDTSREDGAFAKLSSWMSASLTDISHRITRRESTPTKALFCDSHRELINYLSKSSFLTKYINHFKSSGFAGLDKFTFLPLVTGRIDNDFQGISSWRGFENWFNLVNFEIARWGVSSHLKPEDTTAYKQIYEMVVRRESEKLRTLVDNSKKLGVPQRYIDDVAGRFLHERTMQRLARHINFPYYLPSNLLIDLDNVGFDELTPEGLEEVLRQEPKKFVFSDDGARQEFQSRIQRHRKILDGSLGIDSRYREFYSQVLNEARQMEEQGKLIKIPISMAELGNSPISDCALFLPRYRISPSRLTLEKNANVFGDYSLIFGDSPNTTEISIPRELITIQGDNSLFTGFYLVGSKAKYGLILNKSASPLSDLSISNLSLNNFLVGIQAGDIINLNLSNVSLLDIFNNGVLFNGDNRGIVVRDCLIAGSHQNGFNFMGASFAECSDNVVIGCRGTAFLGSVRKITLFRNFGAYNTKNLSFPFRYSQREDSHNLLFPAFSDYAPRSSSTQE